MAEFITVTSIKGPGKYRFAQEPNIDPREESLSRPRPLTEFKVLNYLRDRFDIPYYLEYRPPFRDLINKDIRPGRFYNAYTIKDRSHLYIIPAESEYVGVRFHEVDLTRQELAQGRHGDIVCLFDVGEPHLEAGGLTYDPVSRDGTIRFSIKRKRNGEGDDWGASLTIGGSNPGLVIARAIDWFNYITIDEDLPLWKQTS